MSRHLALGLVPMFLLLGACKAVDTDSAPEAEQGAENAVAGGVADGDYVIKTVSSGHCLDVSGSSKADGARVQEWGCNGTSAQIFRITSTDGGYAKIVNVNSDKALDIKDVSKSANALLQQWGYGGGANQQFKLVDRGNGQFSIQARHTDMALDVFWGNPADGTPIVQYPYTGTSNQRWTFTKVGGGQQPPPPPPGGGGGGDLPTRLRVTNQCANPIWVAHSNNVPDAQNVKLAKGQSRDYNIPDGGLPAIRVWPKVGCNDGGTNCKIGESVSPCPAGGCQPPVDSKFEASFAPKGGQAATWYNLSQVDGYTLPFKVVPRGAGSESGSCVTSDCSHLSLDACPGDEDMSGGGAFPAFAHEDLHIRDAQGNTIGCLAPCKKWNYPAPWGLGQPESADPGLHLCCPTPIDPQSGQCTAQNACMTADSCRNGGDPRSVVHTDYVAAIHQMCPTAYSYSYDDEAGLHNCPSTTGFEVIFCP
jgi:ricin-type beta-trefoil lectin protein/thaumatin family protein